MNKIIDFVVKHYLLVLFFLGVATLPFAYHYANQTYSNSIKVFFEDTDPDIVYYENFQEIFGNDESLVIAFSSPNIFSVETLNTIRKITEAADSVDGVQRVHSLTSTEIIIGDDGILDFELLVPEEELTPSIVETVKEKAIDYKAIQNRIISKDLKTTALIVLLEPIFSNVEKAVVINNLKNATQNAAGNDIKLHYAGSPCFDVEINDLTHKDNTRFTPITFFLIFIIVFWMLKNATLSVLGQFNIVIIVLWGIGLLIMCGNAINSVTVVIAPILLAISIADSIHILSHYKKIYINNGKQHVKAAGDAAKALWLPCLFTSLTTGIGYFSFLVSDVKPVKMVGIFTGIGVMIAFFMSVFFLPAILVAAQKIIEKSNLKKNAKDEAKAIRFNKRLETLGAFVVKHYKSVAVISLCITLFIAFGITKIRYETDFATYLKESNITKKDLKYVEKHLSGTIPVELVITAKSGNNDFTHPESVKLVDRVQHDILEYMKNKYTSSSSIADYIKESHKAFNNGDENMYKLPDNKNDLIDYYEFADKEILEQMLSLDKKQTRISFASHFSSTDQAKRVQAFINSHVKSLLGDSFDYKFTGLSALYVTMDRNLKNSQMKSLGTAFVLIFIMMFFVCHNVKLTIISMIPNMFPIGVTLGIMGWYDIPLDVSTIMIASVTIGIAVDDTIHFITWFRRNRVAGMDTSTAIIKTFSDTGKPIIMTSIVLCSAYFVLITASVKPIISFGALAGLAMFFALIGDLFILPAVIMIFKPEFKTESNKKVRVHEVKEPGASDSDLVSDVA